MFTYESMNYELLMAFAFLVLKRQPKFFQRKDDIHQRLKVR